jgi:hypothetical protein
VVKRRKNAYITPDSRLSLYIYMNESSSSYNMIVLTEDLKLSDMSVVYVFPISYELGVESTIYGLLTAW